MIELVRDLRVINVLAKFENDPWKIMDVRVLTGLVCPAPPPPPPPLNIIWSCMAYICVDRLGQFFLDNGLSTVFSARYLNQFWLIQWIRLTCQTPGVYGEFAYVWQWITRSMIRMNVFNIPLNSRYLASGDSQSSLSYAYRVGRSTICGILSETCLAIWDALHSTYLPVPTEDDWKIIANDFSFWNFPNCVGSLDGKHITMQVPHKSGSEYFIIKTHDTDLHEVSWHFATHEAIRPNGF